MKNFIVSSAIHFVFFLQNLNDVSLKRLFKYLRGTKMTEFCQYPLEDLDPSAGPCINKKGNWNIFINEDYNNKQVWDYLANAMEIIKLQGAKSLLRI